MNVVILVLSIITNINYLLLCIYEYEIDNVLLICFQWAALLYKVFILITHICRGVYEGGVSTPLAKSRREGGGYTLPGVHPPHLSNHPCLSVTAVKLVFI